MARSASLNDLDLEPANMQALLSPQADKGMTQGFGKVMRLIHAEVPGSDRAQQPRQNNVEQLLLPPAALQRQNAGSRMHGNAMTSRPTLAGQLSWPPLVSTKAWQHHPSTIPTLSLGPSMMPLPFAREPPAHTLWPRSSRQDVTLDAAQRGALRRGASLIMVADSFDRSGAAVGVV